MSIPSDIESYLTPDEKMVKIGKSRKWEIYITDKRVIFRKGGMLGKEIVEASYRHISSIEYKKQSPLVYIILGITSFVSAVFFVYWFSTIANSPSRILPSQTIFVLGEILGLFLVLLGIISIVSGLLKKPNFIIHIVGRNPLKISGKELEDLIKIIRQYREKVEAKVTKRDK